MRVIAIAWSEVRVVRVFVGYYIQRQIHEVVDLSCGVTICITRLHKKRRQGCGNSAYVYLTRGLALESDLYHSV